MLLRMPGVYRADRDTQLLTEVLRAGGYARGRRVLDVCTGGGALAVAAARAGAASVTASDLSRRAVLTARANCRLNRVPVTVRRGDLFDAVAGQRFDLVLANPPYVPASSTSPPRRGMRRCWDAGPDGRALTDRICARARALLAEDGMLLLVHSGVCDTDRTLVRMAEAGLAGQVLARASLPFGPVMRLRAGMLEDRGLIRPGQRTEELVVVGARPVAAAVGTS